MHPSTSDDPRRNASTTITVELDVSYQPNKMSGLTTYTVALAEELAADETVRLILCTGPEKISPRYPAAEVHQLTRVDRVSVREDRVRFMPHQMRPAPWRGQTVVTVYDLIYLGRWTRLPKRLAFTLMIVLLRRRHTAVMTDSHSVRAVLLTRGFRADHVAVCQPRMPLGPLTVDQSAPPCGGGGIAYVGNLRRHKDLDTLARAHLALTELETERLHVVTADTGPAVEALEALYPPARRHLLCLHLKSSDAERDAVLRTAKVCVTPSLDEGFGYAIDESLRQGTPVIASFIPSHMENAVGRDVDLFPPGDVKALCSLLATRLRNAGTVRPDLEVGSEMRCRHGAAAVLRRLVER